MNQLDFLNKNMYRKYPLRSTCDMLFIDGETLPSEIITSMQISTTYGKHELFVSKIYTGPQFISVTINDVSDGSAIGCFSGKVTKDFAVVNMTPFITTVSGSMTIGKLSDLTKITGVHIFRDELKDLGTRTNSRIEDSVIFCFTPPLVTKITEGTKEVTGRITTSVSRNMAQTLPTAYSINLAVIDTSSILSNNEFSGAIDSCPTPIIKKINSVRPNSSGNIDIFGIVPITIDIATGEMEIASTATILDVCPEKNKIHPPIADETDVYYDDILTTDSTEWRTWPNYAP